MTETDLHERINRLEEKLNRSARLDPDFGLEMRGFQLTKQRVENHESPTIPADHSLVVGDKFAVEGEVVVEGTLKVV